MFRHSCILYYIHFLLLCPARVAYTISVQPILALVSRVVRVPFSVLRICTPPPRFHSALLYMCLTLCSCGFDSCSVHCVIAWPAIMLPSMCPVLLSASSTTPHVCGFGFLTGSLGKRQSKANRRDCMCSLLLLFGLIIGSIFTKCDQRI